MIPKEIFHYTTASNAIHNILFEKQLEIGPLRYTNDPKEYKGHYFGSFLGEGLDFGSCEFSDFHKRLLDLAEPIKLDEWRVLCFSQHQRDYDPEKEPWSDNLPLSGGCHSSMWAHYADKYRGVCMKFNGNKLNDAIINMFGRESVYCDCVEYNDIKVRDYADGFIETSARELSDEEFKVRLRRYFVDNRGPMFFLKSEDWKSEYEFRWLVHSEKKSPDFIPITGIAEEVLVGSDLPIQSYPRLLKLCDSLGIRAYKIDWINGEPCKLGIKGSHSN